MWAKNESNEMETKNGISLWDHTLIMIFLKGANCLHQIPLRVWEHWVFQFLQCCGMHLHVHRINQQWPYDPLMNCSSVMPEKHGGPSCSLTTRWSDVRWTSSSWPIIPVHASP